MGFGETTANGWTGARRPRLVVAITFPISPPVGGGQVRAFHLYRELAEVFDIELVTLTAHGEPERRAQLAPGLWEHRVPKTAHHAARELAIQEAAGTVVTDIAMVQLHMCTPAFGEAIAAAADGAHAAVVCHPYAFPAVRAVTDIPVWYEAQDVEAVLKRDVLGGGDECRRLLAEVERVERECCAVAELVWACSAEDRAELIARYGLDPEAVLVVPNGAALDELEFVPVTARLQRRRRLRMTGPTLALFIASWHEPNVVGARHLVDVARRCPRVEVKIVGSVGAALSGCSLPDNLEVTGVVSLGLKQALLGIADVALNPVTTGSGTNLKMLDYLGSGIPVISTPFGARGLGLRAGTHYLQAEVPRFPRALSELRKRDVHELDGMVTAARATVEERLSWAAIARRLTGELLTRRPLAGVA